MTTPKKIILISLDTLRADHLGCYGYPRSTSPKIDKIAQEGILFRNAFSPSSHTIPSHGSLFTGKYPSKHSIGFNQNIFVETGKLNTDIDITLAELLKNCNFNTAAFISGIVMGRETNFDAGFDIYDDNIRENPYGRRDCSDTNQKVFNWLTENFRENFFIFIHYFDIHGPYHCQKKYQDQFLKDSSFRSHDLPNKYSETNPERNSIPAYQLLNIKTDQNGIANFETDLGYYIAQYDGCIRYLDDNIGFLLEKLRQLGIYDDTLIIITSDHGEAFGENDIYFYHGLTVTYEQIHVPLIIKPFKEWNVKTGSIDIPVSTLDILPTLLELCDSVFQDPDLQGESLKQIIEGRCDPVLQERVIMSENERQYALIYPSRIMELYKKEIPSSTHYPAIPELIDALDGKKMYWDSGNDYLYTMPFDQYQRYKLISDIINKFRNSQKKFKILDVGAGIEGNLKKFLPMDEIYFLDKEYSSEYSQKGNFIFGDILNKELNEDFDFIVAIDVYEHISAVDRKKFIDILIASSNIGTIIAAPFDQENVKNCEFFANEMYKASHGSDYIWLKEHIANGLPALNLTIDLIEKNNLYPIIIPNGYLPRWFEMISLSLLTEGRPEFSRMILQLNEFYNQNYYQCDNRDPSYRQILIIPKISKIPDFSDLFAKEIDPESISNKNWFLDAFIEKIKRSYQITETSAKRELFAKDKQLTEMSGHIHSLEQAVAIKDEHLAEMSGHIHSLEQAAAIKDEHLAEMSGHVHSLEQAVKIKDEHLAEMSAKAQVLELQIQEQITRIHSLEHNIFSIESSLVWQVTMKFHYKIIGKILPCNTKRRKFYEMGLKGVAIFYNKGWKECMISFKNYQRDKKNELILREKNEKYLVPKDQKNPDTIKVLLEKQLDERLNFFLSNHQKRLIFPKYDDPVVSIIILTFNKAAFTFQCLESILENTEIPYEIILVDNRSMDETGALLKKLDNVIQILNEENLGFILGCNEGAKKARGRYLLFLNNDTKVTEHWLSGLTSTINRIPDCGAIGGKLIWPNGNLQEAGSILWSEGGATGYGRGDDPFKPEYSYLREVDFISGACLLVRADLFGDLNGFDRRYVPAYYEDADLCLGIQQLGFRVLFQPDVIIYHNEFTSSSQENANIYMIKNHQKFLEKWQDLLKTKREYSLENILLARDVRQKKTILYLDDRIPASDQGSGYPRANKLVMHLNEAGYQITVFPLSDTTPWQPYTSEFQQRGIEVFFGKGLDFLQFAKTRKDHYDAVVVSRPHNFDKSYEIIKTYFPGSILVYDAEALFSTREILKAKTKGFNLSAEEIKKMRQKEFQLMKKADLIVTVSENESRIITKDGGFPNVAVYGYPITSHKSIVGFEGRSDILFIGSFLAQDGPNDDAIIYFVKFIWPKIQKNLSCKLYVVGINPPDSILKLASPSIVVTGYVDDLEECYNRCRVFIVPHRYAAGIPLKLLDAMSYGIPSVVSDLIASQLNLIDGREVLVSKDADEFAENVINLYRNQQLWENLQENSYDFIRSTCNPDDMKKKLDQIIENCIKEKR